MRLLEAEEIVVQIQEYIEDKRSSYAILLDGEWGSGKTYFVKNTVLPQSKLFKKTVYISLFGVKNSEDISNRVVNSIIESATSKKLLPIFNVGVKIAGEIASKVAKLDTLGEISSSNLSLFIDYSEYFFIFDDLERSSMPIDEVLGFINYFVEQNDAKVLIVANDKEVAINVNNSVELLKYLIASNNIIDWHNEYEIPSTQNSRDCKLLTLEEIKKRVALFPDDKSSYKIIKEKLIGKTLYFRPNLELVISKMYKTYINRLDNVDDEHIKCIIKIMRNSEYYNLRTIQYCISFYSRILTDSEFLKNKNESIYGIVMNDVLKSLLWTSISYKKGEKIPNWTSSGEFAMTDLSGRMGYQNYGSSFKFIYDYIYFGIYSHDALERVLYKYSEQVEKKQKLQQLKDLQYYWEMEDCDIKKSIESLYREMMLDQGMGYQFQSLLALIYELKDIGIEHIPINDFVKIMRENLTKDNMIELSNRPYKFRDKTLKDEYVEIREELLQKVKNENVNFYNSKLNDILDFGEGWGNEFYIYYNEQKHTILNNGLLKNIDIDKLVEVLYTSKVKDVSDFRRTLPLLYSDLVLYDISIEEIEKLKELKRLSLGTNNKLLNYNFKLLHEFIDDQIKTIESLRK